MTTTSGVQGTGLWFDGRSTVRRPAHLLLIDGVLRIAPDVTLPSSQPSSPDAPPALPMRHKLKHVKVSERFKSAPLALELPDGSAVWLDDDAEPLAQAITERVGRYHARSSRFAALRAITLIGSWPAVMACLLATVVLLVWFDRQGAAVGAEAALKVIPTSVDKSIGDIALKSIQEQWLAPSAVPQARQDALRTRFVDLARSQAPERTVQLRFHRMRAGNHQDGENEGEEDDEKVSASTSNTDSKAEKTTPDKRGGFNAFALPNGVIVLLDGMTNTLSDDELMAVLGHELGHVVHRHSMQAVLRSFGLLSVATVALGDFSSVVATAVSTLQSFHFSRDAEREADGYARTFIKAARLPPGTEASVWRKLLAEQKDKGADDLPAWMSTHPPTAERLKAAEAQ